MSLFRFAVFLLVVASAAAVRTPHRLRERRIMPVEFTVSLDVERVTTESYLEFIKNLRGKLAADYSQGTPVLPPRDDEEPHAFDVNLVWGANRNTVVRIHQDTLVLRGFQMQNPQQWFEFKSPSQMQFIEGSKFLDFGNTYEELATAARQDIVNTKLNKYELGDSVVRLALSVNSEERAISLIVVTQMINEALKFVPIAELIAPDIDSRSPVKVPEWMVNDLENNWEQFSNVLLQAARDPCYKFEPVTINGEVIETVDELRKFLGIIMMDPDALIAPRFAEYKGGLCL